MRSARQQGRLLLLAYITLHMCQQTLLLSVSTVGFATAAGAFHSSLRSTRFFASSAAVRLTAVVPIRRALFAVVPTRSNNGSFQKQRFMSSSLSATSGDDDTTPADQALLGKIRVSIELAKECHGEPNVVFLDGTWWLDNGKRDISSRKAYEKGPRISGARFFDIEDVCRPVNDAVLNPKSLPHMMPTPEMFAAVMDAMHIRNTHHVIVYGQAACPMIFRTAFTMMSLGHDPRRVHVLDGSLQDWIDADGPVDTAPTQELVVASLTTSKDGASSKYQAIPARNVVDMADMMRFVQDDGNDDDKSPRPIIVDVRSPDRFYGRVDEPRPGLRLGHMPTARNLFFTDLVDPNEATKLRPRDELRRLIQERLQIDTTTSDNVNDEDELWSPSTTIVATCGTGVTACALALALLECGKDLEQVYVYDGSWCEWGADPDTPIVQ